MRVPSPITANGPIDTPAPSAHVLADRRRRMHACRRPPRVGKELDRARKRQIRVARPEHRARRGVSRFAENDCRRARRAQRRGVFGVGEEGEIAGDRIVDPGDAADVDVRVAFEAALESRRDVLEFQGVREYLMARFSWLASRR